MSFPLIEFQEYSWKFQQLTLNNNKSSHHHHRSLHFHCRLVAKEDHNIADIIVINEDGSSASRFVSAPFQLHLCSSSSLLSSPRLLLFYHIPCLAHFHFDSNCTPTPLLSLSHTFSFHSISTRRKNDSFQSSSSRRGDDKKNNERNRNEPR